MGRRAALPTRARPDPAHRGPAQWHAGIPARGGDLVPELLPGAEPRDHRVPRGRTRAPRPDRSRGTPGRRRLPLLLHGDGHGGRVQRLPGGVGPNGRLRAAHGATRSGDHRVPPPPAVRAAYREPVDDPAGHRSDRMPRLAGADRAMRPPVPRAPQPAGLPVLVLSGEFDDITTVREARQVASLYPSSRLRIVPSRGHVSDLYYPHRSPAVRWIRRFVGSH